MSDRHDSTGGRGADDRAGRRVPRRRLHGWRGVFALLGECRRSRLAVVPAWRPVAALLGYVVAKLGSRYPSSGGIVTFLIEGFGNGHITGVVSWLLYFAGLIVTAMVAVSFGSYATALFFGNDAHRLRAAARTHDIDGCGGGAA